jgi:hypothetical protein
MPVRIDRSLTSNPIRCRVPPPVLPSDKNRKGVETGSKTLDRLISTLSNQDCQRRLDNPRPPIWKHRFIRSFRLPSSEPDLLLHKFTAIATAMRPVIFEAKNRNVKPATTRVPCGSLPSDDSEPGIAPRDERERE